MRCVYVLAEGGNSFGFQLNFPPGPQLWIVVLLARQGSETGTSRAFGRVCVRHQGSVLRLARGARLLPRPLIAFGPLCDVTLCWPRRSEQVGYRTNEAFSLGV